MPPLCSPPSQPDALDTARREGRVVGRRTNGLGVDCPYRFDIITLRHQWFAGFSEGRAQLRQVLQVD